MPHPLIISLQIVTTGGTGALPAVTGTGTAPLTIIETGHPIDTVVVDTETGHLTTIGGCGSRCGLVLLTLCSQEQ